MNPEELIETLVEEIQNGSNDYKDDINGWLRVKFDGDYLTVIFEESNEDKNIVSKATWKLVEIDE